MRGKRSKAYRKLIRQFELAFGFRQPYQVLVDAELVRDAHRFTMDLPTYLSNTLHGDVKILITQCSMRHLYSQNKEPGMDRVIEKAKGFERRRCGHHPEEYPEPCSTTVCLGSVVGETNKHRYVVASQDHAFRQRMRVVPGVPLIYINRSVMILEPMAVATARLVHKGERTKLKAKLKGPVTSGSCKRKRDKDSAGEGDDDNVAAKEPSKKKKRKGPKGPNPLSVKRPKKQAGREQPATTTKPTDEPSDAAATEQPAGKKRKRKPKKTGDVGGFELTDGQQTQDRREAAMNE